MFDSWICVKDCGQRVVVGSGKKVTGELDRLTERCDPPSWLTMRRLADLKIAINKQTPVNAPHTHVLL